MNLTQMQGCKIRKQAHTEGTPYVPEGSKHSGHSKQHTTQPLPGDAHGTLGWQAHSCIPVPHNGLESSHSGGCEKGGFEPSWLRHRRTDEIQRPHKTWILKKHPGWILLHCLQKCKLVQPLWRAVQRFLEKRKIELPYDPAVPLLGIHLEKKKKHHNLKKNTCVLMFTAALFTIARMQK